MDVILEHKHAQKHLKHQRIQDRENDTLNLDKSSSSEADDTYP